MLELKSIVIEKDFFGNCNSGWEKITSEEHPKAHQVFRAMLSSIRIVEFSKPINPSVEPNHDTGQLKISAA